MHVELDAVILAGGRSERLRGIVPPYHKPFLVINGKSLLVTAVDQALSVGARKIVVVATGENAMPVFQLVEHIPEVRVVLSGGGPAGALLAGLEMCERQRTLVLLSDNVNHLADVRRITAHQYAIGVNYLTCREARRFTRMEFGRWVEGETTANNECDSPEAHTQVWCGPLVIQRRRGLDTLPGREKIGPVLGELAPTFTTVHVSSVDVGVPDVVTELTKE